MENPEKISLQFELLNTYYSKIACKMSHTPFFYISNDSFVALRAEIFEKIFLRIIGACRLRNKFSNYALRV